MQALSDIFLRLAAGPEAPDGQQRDVDGRQLKDSNGSVEIGHMRRRAWDSTAECADGRLRGALPTAAIGSAIAAFPGKRDTFDRAVGAFAHAYREQNELDHRASAAAAV